MPEALAQHELVRAAWDGIDPAKVWDCHCHLAGTGDAGAGNAGVGNAGTGNAGAGNGGTGNAGTGRAGTGNAGTGNAVTGNGGTGNGGTGNAGAGNAVTGYAGTGEAGSGIYLDSSMQTRFNPLRYAQRLFFMNAGCVRDAPGQVDQSYVERMRELQGGMRPGAKLLLLALDASVSENGKESWEQTSLYIPNRYAARVAKHHAQYFEWAASVHPYRRDCVEQLDAAVNEGARALKWLPAAMGIDPASKLCDPFYQALARLDLPLITHAGLERALQGNDAQELGNPLRLRRALDHGVRVVVAHCASMGEDLDIDRGTLGAAVGSFELFARMMDEPRYVGRLYGDLSAMTQSHRAGPALKRVIEREDWHTRLLNGSDYPLPGVFPLYSVDRMVELGYIEKAAAPLFKGLREYNPLLFDFVLKRSLRVGRKRLAPAIFETRDFFSPAPHAAPAWARSHAPHAALAGIGSLAPHAALAAICTLAPLAGRGPG